MIFVVRMAVAPKGQCTWLKWLLWPFGARPNVTQKPPPRKMSWKFTSEQISTSNYTQIVCWTATVSSEPLTCDLKCPIPRKPIFKNCSILSVFGKWQVVPKIFPHDCNVFWYHYIHHISASNQLAEKGSSDPLSPFYHMFHNFLNAYTNLPQWNT